MGGVCSAGTAGGESFDVDEDEVYVSYDAKAGVDVKELAKVVETRAGFKAWVKGEGWGETVNALVSVSLTEDSHERPQGYIWQVVDVPE